MDGIFTYIYLKKINEIRNMGVSKNRGGPPKSSILIGFGTIINHTFWGTSIFGNTHMKIEYE